MKRCSAKKVSGAKSDRARLGRLLAAIDEGDVLIVSRLDRLARSTRDLLNILDTLAKRGATFRSLGDVWADTTTPHGRLMLTVLGGLAEFERELIRQRAGEGRRRAKARGVHMGRPLKLTLHQVREAREALASGAITGRMTPLAPIAAFEPSTHPKGHGTSNPPIAYEATSEAG